MDNVIKFPGVWHGKKVPDLENMRKDQDVNIEEMRRHIDTSVIAGAIDRFEKDKSIQGVICILLKRNDKGDIVAPEAVYSPYLRGGDSLATLGAMDQMKQILASTFVQVRGSQ